MASRKTWAAVAVAAIVVCCTVVAVCLLRGSAEEPEPSCDHGAERSPTPRTRAEELPPVPSTAGSQPQIPAGYVPPPGVAATESVDLLWNDRGVTASVPIVDMTGLPQATATRRRLKVDAGREGFSMCEETSCGKLTAARNLNLGAGDLDLGDALAIARDFALRNSLPADARLTYCAPVRCEGSNGNGRNVAHLLIFGHSCEGVPVAGDRISLHVEPDGVKVLSARWHDVIVSGGEGPAVSRIDSDGLQTCVSELSLCASGEVDMPEMELARPVYYVEDVTSDAPQPARVVWEVRFQGGISVLWDPATKDVVRPEGNGAGPR